MTRSFGKRLAASVASGAVLTLAFPPAGAGWIALGALVPLLLAVRGSSGRRGLACGAAAGITFFAILLTWIADFGFVAYVPLVLLQASAIALFGLVAARASHLGLLARLAGVPAVWAGLELARSRYPLDGFTWGALGTSQADVPLGHLAPIGGTALIAVVVVGVNALLAEAVANRGAHTVVLPLAAALVTVTAPALLPLGDTVARGSLDLALVQGNVPRDRFSSLGRGGGRTGGEDLVIVRNHLRLTERLVGSPPDLIVWPENAIDRDPRLHPELFAPVAELVSRIGSPLLAGAILDAGPKHFRNSNILVAPSGAIVDRYDKIHLVPFGEYVPWAWVRRIVPALDREVPTDGIPGTSPVVFDVGGARVGSVICFESTYAEIVRDVVRAGAEVIVVTTNNASFGTSAAAEQHLAASRMRALETGRTVAHAAISGISAIVLPDGQVVDRTTLFTPSLVRRSIPLRAGETPYVRFGSMIESGIGLAAAAVVVAAARRRRERAEDADA